MGGFYHKKCVKIFTNPSNMGNHRTVPKELLEEAQRLRNASGGRYVNQTIVRFVQQVSFSKILNIFEPIDEDDEGQKERRRFDRIQKKKEKKMLRGLRKKTSPLKLRPKTKRRQRRLPVMYH